MRPAGRWPAEPCSSSNGPAPAGTAVAAADDGHLAGRAGAALPSCGLIAYPRLAPRSSRCVEREGEVLLANGRNFGAPMYSCLAGFVEPGETLEETVHREVGEEVGVKLGEVRYFGEPAVALSPFPDARLSGRVGEWGHLIDPVEIADAGWFSPTMPLIPPDDHRQAA